MNKHVFVVMRMSVISKNLKGTWVAGKEDYDQYVKKILNEDRLDKHFYLFENIALESLKNQKGFDINKDLTLIILTTDLLNFKYREILNQYTKIYPWIKVSYLHENCSTNEYNELLVNEVINKTNSTKQGTLFATVRLDDDDALSNQFLSKLYKFLDAKFIGFGYSAPRGSVGFFNENKFETFHVYSSPNIALGLSFINYYAYSTQKFHSKYISIYNLGNHTNIDKLVPVITDGSYLAYLRTRHINSDSDSDFLTKQEKKKPIIEKDKIQNNITVNQKII